MDNNTQKEEECCEKCHYVDYDFQGKLETTCRNEKCNCHIHPLTDSNWEEEFDKEFVCSDEPDDHPFVAMWNEEDGKYEFWNAYKIKAFIKSTLQQERQRERERIIEIIKSNSKGSFTDAGGNDCWYIDALIKSLSSNKPSNE